MLDTLTLSPAFLKCKTDKTTSTVMNVLRKDAGIFTSFFFKYRVIYDYVTTKPVQRETIHAAPSDGLLLGAHIQLHLYIHCSTKHTSWMSNNYHNS